MLYVVIVLAVTVVVVDVLNIVVLLVAVVLCVTVDVLNVVT